MATTKQQHDKLLGIYTLPALGRRHNGNIAIGQCLAEWMSATFFFSYLDSSVRQRLLLISRREAVMN